MANEISITKRIAWSKGGAQIIFTGTDSGIDQVGEQAIENVQIIGATSEAILFGDVTTPGWMGFKNLNATDGATIHISTANPAVVGSSTIALLPGRSVILESPATAWYAISSTGSSNLLVCAIEL
jgi:hypothetical protein